MNKGGKDKSLINTIPGVRVGARVLYMCFVLWTSVNLRVLYDGIYGVFAPVRDGARGRMEGKIKIIG